MPHSSGGGSHGGGSHSGGSHHYSGGRSGGRGYSGGSSVKNRTVSRHEFSGSKRYVYYDRSGRYHYLYSDGSGGEEPDLGAVIIVSIIFGLIAAGIIWLLLEIGLYIPRTIDVTSYASGIEIDDHVGILDEKKLEKSLNAFLEKTGVSPSVELVYDNEWYLRYDDLETFAYSEYLRKYDDEMHWLVVISIPKNYEKQDFVDWSFECMIGDECYPAFNSESESKFNEIIQKHLLRVSENDFSEQIYEAFMENTEICKEMQVSFGCILIVVIVALIYVFILYVTIYDYIISVNLKKAVRVPKGVKEIKCEYCDSIYLPGTTYSCPRCGAPVTKKVELEIENKSSKLNKEGI